VRSNFQYWNTGNSLGFFRNLRRDVPIHFVQEILSAVSALLNKYLKCQLIVKPLEELTREIPDNFTADITPPHECLSLIEMIKHPRQVIVLSTGAIQQVEHIRQLLHLLLTPRRSRAPV